MNTILKAAIETIDKTLAMGDQMGVKVGTMKEAAKETNWKAVAAKLGEKGIYIANYLTPKADTFKGRSKLDVIKSMETCMIVLEKYLAELEDANLLPEVIEEAETIEEHKIHLVSDSVQVVDLTLDLSGVEPQLNRRFTVKDDVIKLAENEQQMEALANTQAQAATAKGKALHAKRKAEAGRRKIGTLAEQIAEAETKKEEQLSLFTEIKKDTCCSGCLETKKGLIKVAFGGLDLKLCSECRCKATGKVEAVKAGGRKVSGKKQGVSKIAAVLWGMLQGNSHSVLKEDWKAAYRNEELSKNTLSKCSQIIWTMSDAEYEEALMIVKQGEGVWTENMSALIKFIPALTKTELAEAAQAAPEQAKQRTKVKK